MKKLIYQIAGYTGVYVPEKDAVEQRLSLATVTVDRPTEEDVAKAMEIAYNGEYTIEDDGQPEPDTTTTEDILNAMLGVTE